MEKQHVKNSSEIAAIIYCAHISGLDTLPISIDELATCMEKATYAVENSEEFASDEESEVAMALFVINGYEKHQKFIASCPPSHHKTVVNEMYLRCLTRRLSFASFFNDEQEIFNLFSKIALVTDIESPELLIRQDSACYVCCYNAALSGNKDESARFFDKIRDIPRLVEKADDILEDFPYMITEKHPAKSLELLAALHKKYPDVSLSEKLSQRWADHPILDYIDIEHLKLI